MVKKGAYVLVLDVSGQTQQSIKPFEELIFNTLLTKFLHRPFNQAVAVVLFGCKESLHFSFPPPKYPPESISPSSSPSFASHDEAPSITPALYPSVSVLHELRPISPDDIVHIGSFLHRCCFGVEGVRKGEGEEKGEGEGGGKREEKREETREGKKREKRKRREEEGNPKENTEESSQVENEETKVVESASSSSPPLSSPLSQCTPFPAPSYQADFWNALLAAVDCVARRALGVSDSAPLGFESGFATSAAADNEIQIVGKFDQEVNSMDSETRRALLAQIRAYRIWIRIAALVESGNAFKQPTSWILKRIQSLQSLVLEAFPFQRFLVNRVDSMASSQNMSSPVNIRRCNNIHNSNNDPNNSAKPGTANGNITITNGCAPPRLETGSTAVRSHIQWLRTTDDLSNLNVVHAVQSQYAYRGLFVLRWSAKSRGENSDKRLWWSRTGKRIHPVQLRASSESYGGGNGDGDYGVSSTVQGIAVVVYRKSRRLPFPSPDPSQPSRSLRNKGITESRDACLDDRMDQAKMHESLPYGSEVSNDEGSLHFSSNMDLDDEELRPNALVRCEPSLDLIGFVSWEIVNDCLGPPMESYVILSDLDRDLQSGSKLAALVAAMRNKSSVAVVVMTKANGSSWVGIARPLSNDNDGDKAASVAMNGTDLSIPRDALLLTPRPFFENLRPLLAPKLIINDSSINNAGGRCNQRYVPSDEQKHATKKLVESMDLAPGPSSNRLEAMRPEDTPNPYVIALRRYLGRRALDLGSGTKDPASISGSQDATELGSNSAGPTEEDRTQGRNATSSEETKGKERLQEIMEYEEVFKELIRK